MYHNEPVPSYQDMMLYYGREMLRNGADGIYFDNIYETTSSDPDTSSAVETSPGSFQLSYPIFGMRELLKRTATMLYCENKLLMGRPLLRLHMTNCNIVPFMSFGLMTLNWEHHYGSCDYQDRFQAPYILTECLGTQTGTVPNILVQASGEEKIPWIYRTMLATIFAYDLMPFYLHQSPLLPVIKNTVNKIYGFGYGNPGVQVFPGWSPVNPVRLSRPDAKVTAAIKPRDAALLMIGDMGNGGELEIDLSGLKFTGCKVYNAENGQLIGESAKVKITLKKHDFALLKVENK